MQFQQAVQQSLSKTASFASGKNYRMMQSGWAKLLLMLPAVLGLSIAEIAHAEEEVANPYSSSLYSETAAPSLEPHLAALQAFNNPDLPDLGAAEQFLPTPDPLADIRLVIDLSDRRVYVYDHEGLETSYPVAIGREGWETPTGDYAVMQMYENPAWQHPFTGEVVPPGPNNPLGSRWIGFWTDGTNFIGFHGTPNAESVGRPASHGCIRMYNRDVVVLFETVTVGTPVSVVP